MNKDIQIGEFQKYEHPVHAEHHHVSNYIKEILSKKSSGLLGKEIDIIIEEFHCPKCGKLADEMPEHGNAYKCGNCGLNRQSFGNSLYIWDDGIVPEPKDKLLELKTELKSVISSALQNEDYKLIQDLKEIISNTVIDS